LKGITITVDTRLESPRNGPRSRRVHKVRFECVGESADDVAVFHEYGMRSPTVVVVVVVVQPVIEPRFGAVGKME
jgi:hypothetical protein